MSLNNEEKVIEFIEKSSRPLIVIPKNPDGDIIGSALALFWALRKTERTPKIVCADKISRKFSFLTGYDLIEQDVVDEFTYEISFDTKEKEIENSYFVSSENNPKFYFKSKNCDLNKDSINFKPQSFEYDSIFVIGGANLKSLGSIYSNNHSIFSNLPIINIDCRNSNENFGNVNLVDLDCVSVSEIVAKVIEMSSFLKIDNEAANLLLVGIIGKTDNLKSSSAGSEIFYLTGYLLSLGARRNEIVKYLSRRNIWDSVPLIKLKLKRALIMFLLIAATGILLFQITKIEFVKDVNILELPQILQKDNQTLQEDSEEVKGIKFSEILFDNNENNDSNVIVAVARNAYTEKENKTQEEEFSKKLEIPRLEISAKIQDVGLDTNGKMDVPSNDRDVAWYNLGPKPGDIGSAVIAGHLDSKFGKPAVFWNLNKLKVGDDIFVTDDDNNKKRFQVVSLEKYETGTAPMEKIFGADDGVYLNLITCGGVWDKAKNNYTERFVVFTKYVL